MPTKSFRAIEVVIGLMIRNKEGKILFVRSSKWNNKWVMPGGDLLPGEKIMDAAVRQCREETGLQAKPVTIVDCAEIINPKDFYRPVHFISFRCLMDLVEDSNVHLGDHEFMEYSWVAPAEVSSIEVVKVYGDTVKRYLEFVRTEKKKIA